MSVLLPTVLATGCFPGSSVYDGPLKEVTDVVLVEGKEYLAYFKSPGTGIGGSSTSDSAHRYPTLGSVVIIYDDTGIIIPNTITSGEVSAYWGEKGSGITVAQFRLEGEDTQRIELRIDMDAYREFATSYNKGRRTPPGPGGNSGNF